MAFIQVPISNLQKKRNYKIAYITPNPNFRTVSHYGTDKSMWSTHQDYFGLPTTWSDPSWTNASKIASFSTTVSKVSMNMSQNNSYPKSMEATWDLMITMKLPRKSLTAKSIFVEQCNLFRQINEYGFINAKNADAALYIFVWNHRLRLSSWTLLNEFSRLTFLFPNPLVGLVNEVSDSSISFSLFKSVWALTTSGILFKVWKWRKIQINVQ